MAPRLSAAGVQAEASVLLPGRPKGPRSCSGACGLERPLQVEVTRCWRTDRTRRWRPLACFSFTRRRRSQSTMGRTGHRGQRSEADLRCSSSAPLPAANFFLWPDKIKRDVLDVEILSFSLLLSRQFVMSVSNTRTTPPPLLLPIPSHHQTLPEETSRPEKLTPRQTRRLFTGGGRRGREPGSDWSSPVQRS